MDKIKYFKQNKTGRDFVCGDIHGCFDQLTEKLKEVSFNYETDRLFSVGDLIDRGPQSYLASEWIEQPWFHAIRGNHEQMLIDSLEDRSNVGKQMFWYQNGGVWASSLTESEQNEIYDAVISLPIINEVETPEGIVGIVHADLPLTSYTWDDIKQCVLHNDENVIDQLLWGRSRIKSRYDGEIKGIDKIFCGHTIIKELIQLGNVIFIDTGSYMSEYDPIGEYNGITVTAIS